ncbi:MT-A70 family methyltransferase [Actinokineospora bangkokensis]|uniref:Methyltransferase n=1 Tax=Actinokineospora bangkokensis TaxID=1193682 RepID=A0A1Q9LBZ4_9PSEU|nr:MT-A70 family methyltransferase [Actinokineospora bangkokensis]OLR89552.1 methyltransferase [Actinokineospora bangkokensis]
MHQLPLPIPAAPTARRYGALLVDPPWQLGQTGDRGAERHYPLMSLERIKAMPVADLAANNSFLFLWVTNATLRDGYDVAEGWGFTVKNQITWIKFRLGLGNPIRNATEHLLVATKGKPQVKMRSQPSWINAPVQAHSHKPEEQYALIERLADGPYLELFARRRPSSSADWAVWGNQIDDSDITIPGYPVPSDRRSRDGR